MMKSLVLCASMCLMAQDRPLTKQDQYGLAAKMHYDKATACDRVVVACLDRLEAATTDEARTSAVNDLVDALANANKHREMVIRLLLASIHEHQRMTQAKK